MHSNKSHTKCGRWAGPKDVLPECLAPILFSCSCIFIPNENVYLCNCKQDKRTLTHGYRYRYTCRYTDTDTDAWTETWATTKIDQFKYKWPPMPRPRLVPLPPPPPFLPLPCSILFASWNTFAVSFTSVRSFAPFFHTRQQRPLLNFNAKCWYEPSDPGGRQTPEGGVAVQISRKLSSPRRTGKTLF